MGLLRTWAFTVFFILSAITIYKIETFLELSSFNLKNVTNVVREYQFRLTSHFLVPCAPSLRDKFSFSVNRDYNRWLCASQPFLQDPISVEKLFFLRWWFKEMHCFTLHTWPNVPIDTLKHHVLVEPIRFFLGGVFVCRVYLIDRLDFLRVVVWIGDRQDDMPLTTWSRPALVGVF